MPNRSTRARVRLSWAVAACALVAFVPATARGAEPAIATRYSAPEGCPEAPELARQVAQRSGKVALAFGEGRPEVDVAISRDRESYTARLVLAGGLPREVAASSCAEAVSAIAFVIALAYDPDATPPDPPRPAAPVRPIPPPEAPAPARTEAARVSTSPATRLSGPRFVPSALVEVGSLGGLSVGARLGLSVEWSGAWYAPAFRASIGRTLPASVEGEGRRALLTFTDGELEGCGLSFGFGALGARVCAFGLVGAVESLGRVAVPRSDVVMWSAVGLSAPLAVGLGRFLDLEVRPMVGRTLAFDRFYAEPDTSVYEAPALYAKVGVGVRVKVP
ncbi:MAG: hypothetical protein IPK71_03735 [Myxococcales bacterium]|nr:hypothetical protein [Myxococcales bacterium]